MEYLVKNPAKKFEKGATRESSPKRIAETGKTARKATALTQKDSTMKPTVLFSVCKRESTSLLLFGTKSEIAQQETADIRKPASQEANGSIMSTATIAIPRLSRDFEPEKKNFER